MYLFTYVYVCMQLSVFNNNFLLCIIILFSYNNLCNKLAI